MPMMKPLLTSSTPPGNEPLTVKPGVPVPLLLRYTPPLIVAKTLLDWFQPAFTASVRKLALVWLLLIVKRNGPPDPKPKPLALERARVVRIGITRLYVNCV
jgi:hypothetical protein